MGILIDGNNARVQIGNLRVDVAESNAIRVNGSNNRLDIFAFRAEYFNRLNNGSAAIHLANVGAGTPNQVYLGSPALLGNGNSGPLINGSTNGFVASAAPAGRIDRPGVMVGGLDTGISQPSTGNLVLSIGGAELMRVAPGTTSIGGVAGANALTVAAAGYRGWCVLEWECCLKRKEDGAAEGAPFIARAATARGVALVVTHAYSGYPMIREARALVPVSRLLRCVMRQPIHSAVVLAMASARLAP